jgi:hypothetical protein
MTRVGRTSPSTAAARVVVGRAFVANNDPASAASEFGQAILVADAGDDPLIKGEYRLMFAFALADSGRPADARKILASAREWIEKAGARGGEAMEQLNVAEKALASAPK